MIYFIILKIEVEIITGIELRVKAYNIKFREPILSIKAFEELPISLLLTKFVKKISIRAIIEAKT